MKDPKVKINVSCVALTIFVVVFSLISVSLWGGKPETLPPERELDIQDTMTIQEFGESNQWSKEVIAGKYQVLFFSVHVHFF